MADDEKTEEATATDNQVADALKQKKRKLILFIGLGVLLLAGVGGGVMMMLGSGGEAEKVAEQPTAAKTSDDHGKKEEGPAKKDEAAAKKEADPAAKQAPAKPGEKGEAAEAAPSTPAAAIDFGESYNLKPFHVNLGNPLENRYLRLEIALEYKSGEDQKREIEARLPQLRDAVLSVASRKTREFLLGPDGKDELRLELLNRINQYMDKKIEGVYITDILIE